MLRMPRVAWDDPSGLSHNGATEPNKRPEAAAQHTPHRSCSLTLLSFNTDTMWHWPSPLVAARHWGGSVIGNRNSQGVWVCQSLTFASSFQDPPGPGTPSVPPAAAVPVLAAAPRALPTPSSSHSKPWSPKLLQSTCSGGTSKFPGHRRQCPPGPDGDGTEGERQAAEGQREVAERAGELCREGQPHREGRDS